MSLDCAKLGCRLLLRIRGAERRRRSVSVMKRMLMSCLFVLAAGAGSMSAGDLDFTLVNDTGLTINEFYVSPSNNDEWGEDVLGRDVLAHGERLDITFS